MSQTRTRRVAVGRAAVATASGTIDRIRDEVEARPWWYTILDAPLGRELDDLFFADLKRSREITFDAWRKRNPLMRVLQVASRVLDQQS